jgi:hypothetical protein
MQGTHKNYMSIGVSVLTTSQVARNNGIGVRQESNPQSPAAYSFERCSSFKRKIQRKKD